MDKAEFEAVFGQVSNEGVVIREPKVCAMSGLALHTTGSRDSSVRVRMRGTPYFVRYRAGFRLSDERRAELEAVVSKTPKAAPAKEGDS